MRTWDFRFEEIEHRDTEHAEIRGGRVQIPGPLNELCYGIVGAAIEVHRHLGPGFVESAYEKALEIELAARSISFDSQLPVHVHYKDRLVAEHRVDLLVQSSVVVELKAIEAIKAVHCAQLKAYLKACSLTVGLLINFNVPVLKEGVRRILWSP